MLRIEVDILQLSFLNLQAELEYFSSCLLPNLIAISRKYGDRYGPNQTRPLW